MFLLQQVNNEKNQINSQHEIKLSYFPHMHLSLSSHPLYVVYLLTSVYTPGMEGMSRMCFHYSTYKKKGQPVSFLHSSLSLTLLLPFENMNALE